MSSVPARDDIDEEYKWALESLYADDEAWEGPTRKPKNWPRT
jgi:oligoendopeptidase F